MINITSSGIVEFLRTDENGNWRTTITPGDTTRASELLNADELAQVRAAWTPTVIEAWEAQQAAIEAEFPVDDDGPQSPTIEELRAGLVELATEGAISPARLEKLRRDGGRQEQRE